MSYSCGIKGNSKYPKHNLLPLMYKHLFVKQRELNSIPAKASIYSGIKLQNNFIYLQLVPHLTSSATTLCITAETYKKK